MNYSKKILNPLITKLNINTDEDNTFKELISLTYDSPNYQLWAVNAVYSSYCTVEEIKSILAWAKSHKQLICQLSKHTITAYTSRYAITILKKEIKNIQLIDDVKSFINKFNTTQRNLLKEYFNLDNISFLNTIESKELKKWNKIFNKIRNLPEYQMNNFINNCSSLDNIVDLIDAFTWCMDLSYKWDKKDFLEYVQSHTPNSPIIYNKGNIVILHVTNHTDCNKLVGKDGRTKWCINSNKTCWKAYVSDSNNKQYFLFDFSKKENEEMAHIAFTINDELGITNAYTTNNNSLLENDSEYITKVFDEKGININDFIKLHTSDLYQWEKINVKKLINNCNHVNIISESNNHLVISSEDYESSNKLIGHTILFKRWLKETFYRKLYFVYDFNLKPTDPNALICIKTTFNNSGKEIFLMSYNQAYFNVSKNYLNKMKINIFTEN